MIHWNESDSPTLQPQRRRAGRRRHTIHAVNVVNTPTTVGMDSISDDVYGYETLTIDPPPPLPPVEPMSPERQARKQRIRPIRRGGACHSDLLKSAVLATLEAEEECNSGTPNSTSVPQRRHSTRSVDSTAIMTPGMDDSQRNPRKRARQQNMDCSDEGLLEDCLLGAMDFCTISNREKQQHQRQQPQQPQQQPQHLDSPPTPIRHVARRKSKELACGIVPSPRTSGEFSV